ncbi:TonB-dependent siderophore receptor [Oxalobacteraceae bacterium OTU3CAMAD1]|nr:TonB-dependent siderophore receptor [Oxalobacteraceae bacterium OTU3CAMAD1]
MKLHKLTCAVLCLYPPFGVGADAAAAADTGEAAAPVAVVVVDGARATHADGAALGSRLDLSLSETPAAVELISRDLIEARGARNLDEAVRGAVGVTQGGNPSSPSQTSSRGFSAGFVSYLYDGSRVAVPTMSARTQDSWNIDHIEVLKGPASLMAGDGAIGGAINFVTKRADRANPMSEAMLSFGSFRTWRMGVGTNQAFGDASAVRLDYSRQKSDGYIDRNRQRYDSVSVATTTALASDLVLDLSLDVLDDDVLPYQGTPLVPRAFAADPAGVAVDGTGAVIDRRLASTNYNVADAAMDARSTWARAKLSWRLSPEWKLTNEASYYTAKRNWRNAESHAFRAPRQIVRDLVGVTHDHQVLGNRLDVSYGGAVGGMKHRFAAGLEYTRTRFDAGRTFSNGSAAAEALLAVDALDPAVGNYADFNANPALYAGAGNRTRFGTRIPTLAIYAEDALWLSDKWTLVAGVRQDRVKLQRDNIDFNTGATASYAQTYSPRSARIGLVYALSGNTSLYAQRTNASAPVGSGNLLLLSAANAAFALSKGTQSEIGLKQTLLNGSADLTLAAYSIDLDNILTRDAATPTLTVNNGKQSSKGVELAAGWRPTRRLAVSGNISLLHAQFDQLMEAGNVSRAGNVPPNVAREMANLWTDYTLEAAPLRLGMGLNYTGDRYTNTANTVLMRGFTTADAYASWRLPRGELTLRVRNLGDKLYASWSGANANRQVILGAPRSADLTYHVKF